MTSLRTMRLIERFEAQFAEAVQDLLVAEVRDDRILANFARDRVAEAIAEAMGIAEVLGATAALQRAAGAMVEERTAMRAELDDLLRFRDQSAEVVTPRFVLQEAIDDMLARVPVTLREAAERTGRRISEVYSQQRAIAFARATTEAVTKRAQELIVQAMREGWTEGEAGQRLVLEVSKIKEQTETWTAAYAKTAFRTNVNAAVTAGRFQQAQDPAVRHVVPAFRFDAVGDSDTRPNHGAADGRIWSVDNPVWLRLAPPLGFNCRCSVQLVTRPELRRMGRLTPDGQVIEDAVPPGAFPDPGFRPSGRPDLVGIPA